MRFTQIKKEVKRYFDKKIEKQELPGDIKTIYNRAVLDKSPVRKRAWIWKLVPVFGILLFIAALGYIILVNIFFSSPHKSELEKIEKIFSTVPQFQEVLQAKENSGDRPVPGDDEYFLLEMTIKSVLFSLHGERYSNVELTAFFKRVLSHTPTIKKEETITYPDWESSHISDLENRIKKMIEEKQVYRSLIRINKS
ncbi:hypothetical protein ACFLRB_00255 [Acidobacteriota bacterium]